MVPDSKTSSEICFLLRLFLIEAKISLNLSQFFGVAVAYNYVTSYCYLCVSLCAQSGFIYCHFGTAYREVRRVIRADHDSLTFF